MYRFNDSQPGKATVTKQQPPKSANPTTNTRVSSISNPTTKEIQEARASLRLLKSKMQIRSSNANDDYEYEGQENFTYSKQQQSQQQQQSSKADSNSNYRKVFKPDTADKVPVPIQTQTNKSTTKNAPQESFNSKGYENPRVDNRVGLKSLDNNQKLGQQNDYGGYKGYQDEITPKSQIGARGVKASKPNVVDPDDRPISMSKNRNQFDYDVEDRPLPTQAKNRNQFDYDSEDRPLPTQTKNNKDPFGNEVKNENQKERLIECPEGCGRKFNELALEKHVKVCQDVFQSKRKAFDSKAARKTEEQLELEAQMKRTGGGVSQKQKPTGKATTQASKANKATSNAGEDRAISSKENQKAKWQKQSESLRAGMRAARGEKLSHSEQVALDIAQQDDLIPCDHCGRKFNEKAAEKHIPFCANKKKLDNVKATGKAMPTANPKLSMSKPSSTQGRRY